MRKDLYFAIQKEYSKNGISMYRKNGRYILSRFCNNCTKAHFLSMVTYNIDIVLNIAGVKGDFENMECKNGKG